MLASTARDASARSGNCARVGLVALPVLVVDPDPELAALIRQSLEKDYACRVGLAATTSEALAAARADEYRLAIVDLDLPDLREADLIRRLRSLQPAMLLLAISADPGALITDPLGIHACLPKPFYLPDLMAKIRQMLSTLSLTADGAGGRAPVPVHRLGIAAEAARLVARGARDSGAYLVLLTRDGRRWVHAGPMPQAHVEQVVAKIQAYGIRPDAPGAVARYLRFPGAIDAFLLYCLALADEYLLAILYPARVPFGSVRRQAERLAEMLTQPAAPPVPAGAGARAVLPSAAVEEIVRLPHDWVPQPSARYSLPFLETRAEPIAQSVPVPAPASLPGDWLPDGGPLQAVDSILDSAPEDGPHHSSPAAPPPTVVERTRVSLVYVPRDSELALQASLAATLVTWTKEICRALDFRPVDIHVRPDALCLTIELPPGTSPPTAAHRMRQELSRRIAETYPSQAAAAASGRFWTSRYLLMSGEAPSSQRITEFVRETRGTSRAHRVSS